ncbi:MAG: HAD family hydrolase [Clostridia bacterium]|nr:HAD family hydrolase [Clostridia bacterium]
MKYDAVFFDLDGTVIDSLQDIADAANRTFRHFHLPEYEAQALKPFLGWGTAQLMRLAVPRAPDALLQALQAHYAPYYAAHAAIKSRPYPGVLSMMARLKEDGLVLAIVSNKPDAAVQPLAAAFFSDLVALSVGEIQGVRRKPCPDMLEHAAAKLDLDLGRCLYVGDSEVDIDTANNAGIDCVCVTWGFRTREALVRAGAKHIIDAPEQLVAFVEK